MLFNNAKVCGARASARVFSKDELLGMFPTVEERKRWSHHSKREICEHLRIPFSETVVEEDVVLDRSKVCTARKSRLFPSRYTRDELVDLAKARHRNISRAKLRVTRIDRLCALAHLPFRAIPPAAAGTPPVPMAAGKSKRGRAVVPPQGDVGAPLPIVAQCRTRGSKELQRHQQELLDRLDRSRGVLAVHATGSGKTLTAVVASQCYLDEHPRRRVMVLTPASLVGNFLKELEAFGPELRHRERYEVLTYQKFVQRRKKILWYEARHRELPEELRPFSSCRHMMLIVDEAHNFRTPFRPRKKPAGKEQGIMTKHVMACAEQADRVLLLTATPLVNKPKDILTLLNMIREPGLAALAIFPTDIREQRHYLKDKIHFFSPPDDRYREIYPASESHEVFLTMPAWYEKKYNDVETQVATDENLDIFGDVNLHAFFNGMRRATNVLDLDTTREMSPKIQWILNFIQDHPEDKMVIFSSFLDMGSLAVFRRLPAAIRNRVAFVTGQTPRKDRQRIVDEYNKGEKKFLFLSKAGGEGLDLKGTRRILLLEPAWNQSAEQQVTGRGIRYKSHAHLPFDERVVDVYRLYLIKASDAQNLDRIVGEDLLWRTAGGEAVGHRHGDEEEEDNAMVSIDLMIRSLQRKKETANQDFLRLLRDRSSGQ
jgi:superfamily II DNA or RNA helicase